MDININSLARDFKVLGDENRLKILILLLRHDLCVNALARHVGISESGISQHLKLLREAGLVRGEKRGYFTHYSVNREQLKSAAARIEELAAIPKSCCNGAPECGEPIKGSKETDNG